MARKLVRFNYFEVELIPAPVAIREELYEEQVGDHDERFTAPWDMTELLDAISINQFNDTTIAMGDEYVEIEPGSLTIPDNGIRSFQLSKLRETDIPAKKKIGEIREEIQLEDDEYIGEFVSIIYDERHHVLMVQSNKYGLTTKQIERYLTDLRLRYLQYIGQPDAEVPLVVKLSTIIDVRQAETILDAGYFRKIKMRGADFIADAIFNDGGYLSTARRLLYRSHGAYIEISVSVGRGPQNASLNEDVVRELVEEYRTLPESQRPNIEISKKDEENSEIEVVNLIEPRMTDKISLEVEPRTTIGHQFLYVQMREIYNNRRAVIARILLPAQ